MAETEADADATIDDRALLERDVSPEELVTAAIPMRIRGYDTDFIDALLKQAAATIQRFQALGPIALEQQRREHADLMQRALMIAQASADETTAEARRSATAILEDAEDRAKRLVTDAEQLGESERARAAGILEDAADRAKQLVTDAEQLVESERARAAGILEDALRDRDRLEADVAALDLYKEQATTRLRAAFEVEMLTLGRLNDATEHPVMHEIEATDVARELGKPVNNPKDARGIPPGPAVSESAAIPAIERVRTVRARAAEAKASGNPNGGNQPPD